MAYRAPGNRSVTAWAITCAVECRSTSRPSGVAGVTIVTAASWSIGRSRSTHSPSTLAASASFARRFPIDAATSAAVTPFAYSRLEPSGSVIVDRVGGAHLPGDDTSSPFSFPDLCADATMGPCRRTRSRRSCCRGRPSSTSRRSRRRAARLGLPIIEGHVALDARRAPRHRRHRRLRHPDAGRDHPRRRRRRHRVRDDRGRDGPQASDLPDDLDPLVPKIERAIPAGRRQGPRSTNRSWPIVVRRAPTATDFSPKQVDRTVDAVRHARLGKSLRLPLRLDERDRVWAVVHSGSRGIGNELATDHIDRARKLAQRAGLQLEDRDLAYFSEGTQEFDDYVTDMLWAQEYALANREQMMDALLDELIRVRRHWLGGSAHQLPPQLLGTERHDGRRALDHAQGRDPGAARTTAA